MTPATFISRFLLFALFWLSYVFAQVAEPQEELGDAGRKNATTRDEIVCRPFGPCEPCPKDALQEPFCQPFGNRRLMHCLNTTAGASTTNNGARIASIHLKHKLAHSYNDSRQGETPAWESCGRIVEQERADFWEFVACNVAFAGVSLFVLFARSRRLQALQARQLAARIGLIRPTNRGRQ